MYKVIWIFYIYKIYETIELAENLVDIKMMQEY